LAICFDLISESFGDVGEKFILGPVQSTNRCHIRTYGETIQPVFYYRQKNATPVENCQQVRQQTAFARFAVAESVSNAAVAAASAINKTFVTSTFASPAKLFTELRNR